MLKIKRGDTVDIPLCFYNKDGYINLTDCTIFFTVKEKNGLDGIDDTNSIISKDILPVEHTNPKNGETVLSLTSTDTDVSPNIYYCDIQIASISGKITSTDTMEIMILQDVTKRVA
jgi:hypothetical protein